MKRGIPWRETAFALFVALLGLAPVARAQSSGEPPDDDTTAVRAVVGEEENREKDAGADRDSATARLEWQRKAWGATTSDFRGTAMREGDRHRDRRRTRGPLWVNIGPTGADYEQNGSFTGHVRDSGRARTILPHPTDPDIVYLLTSGGGLWRTDNWTSDRSKWRVLTDDLPTTGGGAVAFGRDPNTLYLGLGDPYDQILVGGAVVKSRNGGERWGPVIELGGAVSVRDVKVDTSGVQDVVLVATDLGLFRSADSGATYAVVPGFEGQSVWSLARTSAGWLVSSQPCPVGAGGLVCGLASTLSLSTDVGATWAPITNAGGVFNNNGRTTLGVAAPGDSVVYAYSSTVNEGALRDVYRSADGGQTWVANGVNSTSAPSNPNGSMPNLNVCQSQCWYNQMVVVDPRDAARNTVWIGGNLAAAQTRDGGASWSLKTWWLYNQIPDLPYAHADHHAAAFKLTGTPALILGNDGGINVTEDDGATFSSDKNVGLASHLYYTVSGNAKLPNLVIGGQQDNGTRLRTDNSTIHNQVIGGDGLGTAYSQDNTNTVLGSAQGSSMRTNPSGTPPVVFQNWAAATSGLSDAAGFGFSTAIIPAPPGLDPTGKVFFHFSGSRVWRTDNGGLSWTRIASATTPVSPGLPSSRRFRSSPYNLGVSPADLKRIAVGAGGGFLDITTDGGASWTDVNLVASVPGYLGFVTNVTWQDNQTLWITSVAQAAGAVRVIKASIADPTAAWSTATFEVKQSGLPDLPVTRVYVDPRDATKATLYAATHVGVYVTNDGGASWAPYGIGLPTVRVNDIYMPPDGGFMRVATYGRGVWELSQLEFVSAELRDDRRSCDGDGVLDNGERGSLGVTLRNQTPKAELERVTATVTSSNPHLTFPAGNVLRFEGEGRTLRASLPVALDGAVGIETADLQISIASPDLGLPGPFNVTSTHRVNYDDQRAASATETFESKHSRWTISGGAPTSPNILPWQKRALSPTRTVFWGPDNNGQTDGQRADLPDEQILTSPVLKVGAGPLVISFWHRFSFEATGWDGGVIEASTDGGSSWTDIGAAAYNGSTNGATASPIGANRRAFVNRMVGWPSFANVTLDLGTAFANRDVIVRFRIGADESTGAPGWDIDDITILGLTNTPFGALVPNAATCGRRP